MLKQGDKIGEYILINKVGSGGFGDVWKAEKRTALDANYFALKFFRPKEDRLDFDKIGKEIKVWKQLKGLPHIISVTELDQFDDYVYVVSDFAEGGSLEGWLKNNGGKASSQAEAVKITLEILRGLENLHEKGFVHRDLKPDNILIMNGKYCLADFGVSREIKTHSKATGTAGTMEYMPPESFAKTPSVTPQTDIWAVGVILQKLLTGELPYPQEDYPSLIAAITMFEPDEMPTSISEGLREIIKKALQKDRENRFQTASEMREALKNPPMFSAERAKKVRDSGTIIDEDFDKTEVLKPEPTEDWQAIEAEKERQREKEEQERLQSEKAERERLERERLQRKAEARRIEREKEEKLRRQKAEAEDLRRQKVEEEQVKTQRNFLLGLFGGTIGILLLVIWLNSAPTVSISNSNQSNFTKNTPTTNTVSNAANKPSTNRPAANNALNTASSSTSENFKNSIGMEFVKIPAGSFMMGSDIESDEKPIHKVTISQDFWLQKTEVTQSQWQAVMGNNPSNFKADNLPVENVSWDDAQEFIKKLNAKGEGTYRLPTEAEWECAARAGTTGDYAGNLDSMGWYSANSDSKTHPVGTKQANAWGLYDMHGNVWEWCQDWYGEYPSGAVTNPTGATSGSDRVGRGGGWSGDAVFLRSANRSFNSPSYRSNRLGFRVVRN